MKVHKQKNMSDCGLLATAYATSIYAMVMMSVLFSMLACSTKMRAHLVKCCQESKMSPFPSTVALSEVSYVEDKISVIYHCCMPEKGKMIQCSQCKEWIHQACEKLYLAGRGLKGCLFGTASLVKKEQPEKNWPLFELVDTDNSICVLCICSLVYMPWATCCSVWYLHRNCLYTGVHMCTWRLYAYIACGGGRRGGGQVILKRTDNPRKECP